MKLHSQEVRKLAPENDPLKIGMGWSVADLDKPQILVESSFGDSHPGSAHLNQVPRQLLDQSHRLKAHPINRASLLLPDWPYKAKM